MSATITVTTPTGVKRWRDRKRYLWILALVIPLIPIMAFNALRTSEPGLNVWGGPIAILIIGPIIDTLFRTDRSNPPDWAVDELSSRRYYRWLTYLYTPLQYLGLVLACSIVSTRELGWVNYVGFAATVGTVAGIGIANAHELGHKKEANERWLSKVVLAQSAYGHFFVEHNRGHHSRVATPEDPASARLGESFWAFLPRTVVGSLQSAWRLESTRFRGKGKSPWTLRNNILNAWLMTVVLFVGLTIVFGWKVLPFLVIQAVVGFSLLEVVNYLEHYGLLRQKVARAAGSGQVARAAGSGQASTDNDRYERCQPQHSWNSNHIASNVFLYHLERHSDHHAHPTRRYQSLRHFDEAPQLPTGYAALIGVALVPPLWFRLMDKRVVAHYGGDVNRANIHPPKRDKVLARWASVDLRSPASPPLTTERN